jgi:hypothetical protein
MKWQGPDVNHSLPVDSAEAQYIYLMEDRTKWPHFKNEKHVTRTEREMTHH